MLAKSGLLELALHPLVGSTAVDGEGKGSEADAILLAGADKAVKDDLKRAGPGCLANNELDESRSGGSVGQVRRSGVQEDKLERRIGESSD